MVCEADEEDEVALEEGPEDIVLELYGTIDEEKAANLIGSLYTIRNRYRRLRSQNAKLNPIDLIINSEGGSAPDMFAIYDAICIVKAEFPIRTIGLGRVMSAGVLLLAAGTKGIRCAGEHTRFMMHSVSAGNFGSLAELENSYQETMHVQHMFTTTLASNSKLTAKKTQRILQKKIDFFFDVDRALQFGIIDSVS